MREREKIMVMGIGELGGIVLEFLCRIPGICEIVTADINADYGFKKTNSARIGAAFAGLYPDIKFHHIDLLNIEKTAEFLKKVNPTIIYSATTLQSWWVVHELPHENYEELYKDYCGLGPWVAMHLALNVKLMKAVKQSEIDTYVINSSFPDATNPSLARVGLAPTVGIGNLDNAIPAIKICASEILNVPMSNITAEFVGYHYHGYNWARYGMGNAPYHLRIYAGQEDVTEKLGDIKKFVDELPKRAMRPAGRHGQFLIAASALKNIMAIYNDTKEMTHAPGPQGLEGGYPVRLSRKGAEVILPKGMTIEQARKINLEAQKYDGVEEIKQNGDIVLTDEAYTTFKKLLNMDCKAVTINDSYEQAMELRKKFNEFARKHGVNI